MAGFIVLSVFCAYVIGSVPTAYIMGRLRKGVDVRLVGSRNMGAMNVFYKVGFWEGVLVLAVDIGKGVGAVALAHALGVAEIYQLLAGLVVVLGHAFPIFLKFRGGKGGATSIGVLIYLMPWAALWYLGFFGIMLLVTRFPTLSYSAAFICFPFVAWLVYDNYSLVAFPFVLLLVPTIKYIPRLQEMRAKSGDWRHVFLRRGLKDRL